MAVSCQATGSAHSTSFACAAEHTTTQSIQQHRSCFDTQCTQVLTFQQSLFLQGDNNTNGCRCWLFTSDLPCSATAIQAKLNTPQACAAAHNLDLCNTVTSGHSKHILAVCQALSLAGSLFYSETVRFWAHVSTPLLTRPHDGATGQKHHYDKESI